MISRNEHIAAALHRALQWVEDHPPANGPTLGEAEDAGLCRLDHPLKVQGGRRRCVTCSNARQRERRAKG